MRAPVLVATLLLSSARGAQSTPRALYADPPHDAKHPARNEVLHLPTHGVQVNGLAFLAAGPGRHPTFVYFHGLPGNEKGHDLAQASLHLREQFGGALRTPFLRVYRQTRPIPPDELEWFERLADLERNLGAAEPAT